MRPRKCVIEVKNNCDNCPHFDNVYYSYQEMCNLLNKKIPRNREEIGHAIPEDCPLPYWTEADDDKN